MMYSVDYLIIWGNSSLKLEFHRENRTHRRHRAETHRHFNIRVFGPMPPDASDLPVEFQLYTLCVPVRVSS